MIIATILIGLASIAISTFTILTTRRTSAILIQRELVKGVAPEDMPRVWRRQARKMLTVTLGATPRPTRPLRKCPRTVQHENTSMTPTTPPLCYTFELTAGLRHPEHTQAGPT